MLAKLNQLIEQRIAIITPLCMVAGILGSTYIEPLVFIIPWLFAFLTFTSSLGIQLKQVGEIIRSPLPVVICILILQVVMPAIAYVTGILLFPNDPQTITGLVLAFSIPTAIASLIWVSFYDGNSSLTLTIVFINTLLSPLFIPLTLYLLFHTSVSIDGVSLMKGLLLMIFLPSLLGIAVNHFSEGTAKSKCSFLFPLSKAGLLVVIIINGSVVAPYFKEDLSSKVVLVTLVVFCIAFLAYIIGYIVARLLRFDEGTVVSLIFTSGMRNIGVGSALAIVYFSPAVALPVIVGTLFQQVLAALIGRFLIPKRKEDVFVTQLAK